jgi:predicted RNA binding protein YcfA (HicA-like mRNA interferase family)
VHEKLPQVSGQSVVKLLEKLGYEVVRQRGSHVRLVLNSSEAEHHITIPLHNDMAKGTLNDVLSLVSAHTGKDRDKLIILLR